MSDSHMVSLCRGSDLGNLHPEFLPLKALEREREVFENFILPQF